VYKEWKQCVGPGNCVYWRSIWTGEVTFSLAELVSFDVWKLSVVLSKGDALHDSKGYPMYAAPLGTPGETSSSLVSSEEIGRIQVGSIVIVEVERVYKGYTANPFTRFKCGFLIFLTRFECNF
jgi:hypothetical protein